MPVPCCLVDGDDLLPVVVVPESIQQAPDRIGRHLAHSSGVSDARDAACDDEVAPSRLISFGEFAISQVDVAWSPSS